MCIYVCINTYIYICMYVYIYIYIYILAQELSSTFAQAIRAHARSRPGEPCRRPAHCILMIVIRTIIYWYDINSEPIYCYNNYYICVYMYIII